MKSFIYPEMMVHVPLCTHKNPETVLVISDDTTRFNEELARYRECNVRVIDASSALEAIRELEDKAFDVVLSEATSDTVLLAHISRVSKEDALIAITHPDLEDLEANRAIMKALGKDFKVIMPYNAGDCTLLLASKEYHPTADIILQRSDLLEGQQYYNCDVHPAAFAMGNYVRKAYLGLIRN
ncbi:MAG: spermidine synthase [Campylobacterota bacterium]|nr:spermidine synthase [Campylobacterota bacterium]